MSSLFTPYKLGPVTLRNRTVRSAAFESMGRHFGPTEQLKEYHVSVARGGVGMTTLAYAAVCRSGLSFASGVRGFSENLAAATASLLWGFAMCSPGCVSF